MPALFWHEGVWLGNYRHLSEAGELLDEHESRVECLFPEQSFKGYLHESRLWFDTETFAGWSWQTDDGIIMLALDRKDFPGQRFIETIIMGSNKDHRVRTWHWFDDGVCYKRTLCTEQRI
jgi:hypothetical protein